MRRILYSSLVLVLAAGAPSPAAVTPEESWVLDRWEGSAGGFFTNVDTVVRFDRGRTGIIDVGDPSQQGTPIDFERDLGLSDTETTFGVQVARVFGKRHQLRFGFTSTDRRGTSTIDREIRWSGETFPVNADVEAFFNADLWNFDYTVCLEAKDYLVKL